MENKFKAQIIESSEAALKGKEIACNIIYDDMTKPPKWFQHWSETVYQNQPPKWFQAWSETVYQKQPPQWFQNWSETRFEPLVDKVNNIESDVKDLKSRMIKVEDRLDNIDNVIKINNLRLK